MIFIYMNINHMSISFEPLVSAVPFAAGKEDAIRQAKRPESLAQSFL